MIDSKKLLSTLQKHVRQLEEDLRARCDGNADVDRPLRVEYEAAKKKGRTAQTYSAWRDEELTQVAVAWVLASVFVRFLEDNELIETPYLAGPGSRLQRAKDEHEMFFRKHPTLTEREYFEKVFTEVGTLPAMKEFFDRKHNPLWQVAPSGDAAKELLDFWRKTDPDTGALIHDFTDPEWNTRFLGDLYQDLSEAAQKKFALLQTPDFVEEFILDRTLNPAIQTFGYQVVRMIDPTCGSGHFLLAGFRRLFRLWLEHQPGENPRVLVQKALDGVFGVDLNPYAVAIARFRLLLAGLNACGARRLKDAPAFRIRVAVGDSLLHGPAYGELPGGLGRVEHFYEAEDAQSLGITFSNRYHAVVGNPPYITVKDKALNRAYRDRFGSCCGKYPLSVPFMELFFYLALKGDRTANKSAGFIGQITSNSFMKREFAKKLIEEFIPRWNFTHVVDSSGAYIPGHGTPTVILFGKHEEPVNKTVRTVMGIKGEPAIPEDPARGKVWSAILDQIDRAESQSAFVSVADKERATFNKHPWSIGGGGASELKATLDENAATTLESLAKVSGVMAIPGDDDVLIAHSQSDWTRKGIAEQSLAPFLEGELVRDFQIYDQYCCIFPYSRTGVFAPEPTAEHHLWLYRSLLRRGICFGKTREERGMDWREWAMIVKEKFPISRSIIFPGIATHNHFVIEEAKVITKQSLPLFRLKNEATDTDYLKLLGLLNSSIACFWMKQACYPKERATGDISKEKCRAETNRYDFNSSAVMRFPVPDMTGSGWDRVSWLAEKLQTYGMTAAGSRPSKIFCTLNPAEDSVEGIKRRLAQARMINEHERRRAVMFQEELDWSIYSLMGLHPAIPLIPTRDLEACEGIGLQERPFKWPSRADSVKKVHDLIRETYEQRYALLQESVQLSLLETDVFKRPWLGRRGVYGRSAVSFDEQVTNAARNWLLNRLEAYFWGAQRVTAITDGFSANESYGPATESALSTTNQLASVVQTDHAFLTVAELLLDGPGFSVPKLVRDLVESASVPVLPIQRYKDSGLRKRRDWEHVWDLQRKEDAIDAAEKISESGIPDHERARREGDAAARKRNEVGEIPVPPKYKSSDFKKSVWWSLRGELDVQKERWISYPGAQRDGDPSPLIAWAGWNYLQQAQALAGYYLDAKSNQGWPEKKLKMLLAGLLDLLPWLKQWHNKLDPDYGMGLGDYFEGFIDEECRGLGLTIDAVNEARYSAAPDA